ncbi:MAG: hypothetical protein GX050_06940 [Firmicutes bacterium]|nr:hypothetical protein [Bacillota bacterium]
MKIRTIKNGLKPIILAFLFLSSGLLPVAAAENQQLEIEALQVEFDPEQRIYVASGEVRFSTADFLLEAEHLLYYQEEELVIAEKDVKLVTSSGTWKGEKIEYSLREDRGRIITPRGTVGQSLLSGEHGGIDGDQLYLEDVAFTRCALSVPCIKIKTSRVVVEEDKIKSKWGWLYLKNLPVLPLPPLTLPADGYDNWPQLEVGANSTRGLFVEGIFSHQVSEGFVLNYGMGLGTNQWQRLRSEGRWTLTPNLTVTPRLFWEPGKNLNGNATLVYRFPRGVQLRAEVDRDWKSQSTVGEDTLSLGFPLFGKTRGELVYSTNLNDNQQRLRRRQDYGGRITTRLLPGFTLSTALFYGDGNLPAGRFNDWYWETSWNGGVKLASTWRVEAEGKHRWQSGKDLKWVTNKVRLVKDLHCFKASLGYNINSESYEFALSFNW